MNYSVSTSSSTEALILPFFKDELSLENLDFLSSDHINLIENMFDSEDFEGEKMESNLLYTTGNDLPKILLLGLGEKEELTLRAWKRAVSSAVKQLQESEVKNMDLHIPEQVINEYAQEKIARETTTAVETASYSFDKYKDEDDQIVDIESVNYVHKESLNSEQFEAGIEQAKGIAEGVNLTRDLGNTPPGTMSPSLMAEKAREIAEDHENMEITVYSQKEIEEMGMNCFLGVADGSEMEPKFIVLEWRRDLQEDPKVLAGKGITFDSGGLSLKPSKHMTEMKFDMLGAGTVFGVMKAAANINLDQKLVAIVPSCENMPSGNSYRPDDILEAKDGSTVEIKNTDAEGRLTLADAFGYIKENHDPELVLDYATLTGACMVALGKQRSGLFTSKDELAEDLLEASENVAEQLWRLPVGEEYSKAMESKVADIKNMSGESWGGASTAAAFLQHFTDDEWSWAHMDLSSSFQKEEKPWSRVGANGFGVQTTIEFLQNYD